MNVVFILFYFFYFLEKVHDRRMWNSTAWNCCSYYLFVSEIIIEANLGKS